MENQSNLTGISEDQELYRTMIESSRDGIIITQNGKFRFLNKAFAEMISDRVTIDTGVLVRHD